MDERIKRLVDFTKEKYGLDHYYLKRHSFDRDINIRNETIYTLSMEWFPKYITEHEEDDSNPEGTAVVEIEVETNKTKHIIFVGGKTYARGISFKGYDRNDIIQWIEDETGLTYGSQFQLQKEGEGELHFRGCIDGIPVSPSGYIEVHFNEEGQLTLFSINGHFPSKEIVNEEKYSLTFEKIESLAKQRLRLIKFPQFDQGKLVPVYGVEEVYVANSDQATLPFVSDFRSYLQINEPLYWDEVIKQPLELKEISWSEEITAEQAFQREPSPDSYPITNEDIKKCLKAVQILLSQEYTNQSGKWVLETLNRERGYIQAILRLREKSNELFQRKVVIFIDSDEFQVINYVDNKGLIEVSDGFKIEGVDVSKEEAYQKLKTCYLLEPYYVYNFELKRYILCGKIDCEYGVKASNGKIISLQDL